MAKPQHVKPRVYTVDGDIYYRIRTYHANPIQPRASDSAAKNKKRYSSKQLTRDCPTDISAQVNRKMFASDGNILGDLTEQKNIIDRRTNQQLIPVSDRPGHVVQINNLPGQKHGRILPVIKHPKDGPLLYSYDQRRKHRSDNDGQSQDCQTNGNNFSRRKEDQRRTVAVKCVRKHQSKTVTESKTLNVTESKTLNVTESKTLNVTDVTGSRKLQKQRLCWPSDKKHELCRFIETDICGADRLCRSLLAFTPITYLDYVASGRPLKCIETYIRYNVMPTYSNTHTEVNCNAQQTSKFREEARDIIRECVNASPDDVVVFTGSGTTAAINKLLYAMNLHSNFSHNRFSTTVLLGPYEHHSNILPWRESGATVITIRATPEGLIDLEHLSTELQKCRCSPGRTLIGSFSAASNVTGILTDCNAIATLLHRHGALALFDYACAAPYVDIDMNPAVNNGQAYKDAVFISPHKFIGGPQTPGILVAKRWLFKNEVPHNVGGGTVIFVRRTSHRYLAEIESREEGGTPAIIESIRAGLVFKLKEAFTSQFIMDREREMFRLAVDVWSKETDLLILGNTQVDRLPIFSMMFTNQRTGRFLHHDFVAKILNDLFGIQVRSGCACAGPYGMELLGMTEKMAARFERYLVEPIAHRNCTSESSTCRVRTELSQADLHASHTGVDNLIFKPGFVRLNFPFFISEACFNFVLQAIQMTAQKGWSLLPLYKFNRRTGRWWYKSDKPFQAHKSLQDITFTEGSFQVKNSPDSDSPSSSSLTSDFPGFDYEKILERAEKIFEEAMQPGRYDCPETEEIFPGEGELLRWFMLPCEAADIIHNKPVKHLAPENLTFLPEALERKLLSAGHVTYSEPRDGSFYQAFGVENIPFLGHSCSPCFCHCPNS